MGKSSDQETLRALRNPRGVAIAGILFAVVFAISIILLRSALPKEPFADVEWVRQEAGRMRVALFLIPFAGIFFLWFMGVVREYMGNLGDWFFSTLLIGSGVLFLAMIFVAVVVAGAIVDGVPEGGSQSLGAETVGFGRSIMLEASGIYAVRMAAVFMFALGTVGMKTRLMPKWLWILTYILAALLLIFTNQNLWFTLIFPAWVLLVSIRMLVTGQVAPSDTAKS